jgi:HEAT repeat protein
MAMPRIGVLVFFSFFGLLPGVVRAADEIDSVMYRDPQLPVARVVKTFPDGLVKLWLGALDRPETDYKCNAALAIAAAHGRGLTGLDATVAPLIRELDRADQHPTVRLTAARTLVTLDARAVAPSFFRLMSEDDPTLREVIEPALAKWDHAPARAVWLARLDQSNHRRATVLAIQALAAVREEKAVPRLRDLVLSRDVSPAVRLEAARALAVLCPAGWEDDAGKLVGDMTPRGIADRVIAVTLLRQHKGGAAVRQLQALAADAEPAVGAVALARLVELDAKLVTPLMGPVLASPDANVRGFGVEALFRQPGDANIRLLGDRLADAHPDVRAQARRAMRDLAARPEWRGAVIREATRVLAASDWRGLEQAAVLVAQLDHKAAAGRLVVLLPAERPEVFVAAAWGLRQLAVADTLPTVLEYFDQTVTTDRRKRPAEAVDLQLSHLAQFMGQSKYEPADGTLRALIPPRSRSGPETRAAAAWALGLLHQGKADPSLTGVFVGRITAVNPGDLEDTRVRRMSAVALGRMKAADALGTLREFYRSKKPSLDIVNNACGWAIEQITGERVPEGTVEVPQRDWFLVPLK